MYDGWQGVISDIYELSKDISYYFHFEVKYFLFDSFYLRMRLNEKDERYEAVLASLKLISNLMSFDDVCFLTFPFHFLNSFIFILTNY